MKICVVGLGYIGLPTAALLANSGYIVYGYDINQSYITNLKAGNHTLTEKGFDKSFQSAISSCHLTFGTTIQPADVFIVAVSTNLNKKTKKIDLSNLKTAIIDIKRVITTKNLVIIESTVTPGTTLNLVKPILDSVHKKYYLAFCPERVLPGNLMRELIYNDRIIGGINKTSTIMAKSIYASFCKGHLHETDSLTAELSKLMENTYRAVNIALANELALICERIGGNVWKSIALANNHPRVHLHYPGPGVGGYCLTKDPWFLIQNYKKANIILASLKQNTEMPIHIIKQIIKKCNGLNKNTRIGIFGISYKGDVADTRESPSFIIINLLKRFGATIRIHDPYVDKLGNLYIEKDISSILNWADCAIIVTDHSQYKSFAWHNYSVKLIDTRNITNLECQ